MNRRALPGTPRRTPPGTAGTALAVVLVSMLVIVTILPVFLVGALVVQLRAEFGFTNTIIGALVASYYVTSGVAAVHLGKAVDRIGWQRAAILAGIVNATAAIGLGTLAATAWQMALFLALSGLTHAVAMSASNALIIAAVVHTRQAFVFGAKQSAAPLGLLLAGASIPMLVLTLGWRSAFIAAAVLSGIVAALLPVGTPGRSENPVPPRRVSEEELTALPPAYPSAARRPMWAWVLAGTAAAAGVGALSSFLVATAVATGLSQSTAGTLLVVASLCGIGVRLLTGLVIDLRGSAGTNAVIWLIASGCIGFVLLATQQPSAVVLGALVAFGCGWGWPGAFHFAVVRQNAARPAAATGAIHAGLTIGAASGPLIFGALIDVASYTAAWLVTSTFTLAAALVLALTRDRRASFLDDGRAEPHR